LLLCGGLQAEVERGVLLPDENGAVSLSRGALLELLRPLRKRYRTAWGSELKVTDLDGLADRLLAEGRRIGLFRGPGWDGRIWVLPAVAAVRGLYPEGDLTVAAAEDSEGE
jgi:hypothetical protein